jgi:hypothetical protein
MSKIAEVLQSQQETLLTAWIKHVLDSIRRTDLISDKELKMQATELLNSIATSTRSGKVTDITGPEWASTREMLR